VMEKAAKKGWRRPGPLITIAAVFFAGLWLGVLLVSPSFKSWWKTVRKESKRILGVETLRISPEENRIREEVILKKMEEASAIRDWRDLAPEYPRAKKLGNTEGKEGMKAFRESREFKEMDKTVNEFLSKREDPLRVEPPTPSLKDGMDFTRGKDRGTEEVMARLLNGKEKTPPERPLEENLQLGIKGPLVTRKIIERPPSPQIKGKVEAEIELTFWVLPNGTVDRVIPSVKGDTELEGIAVRYMMQWRFAAMPKDQPQVEQWGSVPIKFRLQ